MIMGASCLIEDGGFALNLPKRKKKKKKTRSHEMHFFLSLKKAIRLWPSDLYTLYKPKKKTDFISLLAILELEFFFHDYTFTTSLPPSFG